MLDSFKSWWNQPYQDNMSVPRWALFVLLLMVLGIIWTLVIKNLNVA